MDNNFLNPQLQFIKNQNLPGMKKIFAIGLLIMGCFLFTSPLFAQEAKKGKNEIAKTITAEDKTAFINLFNDLGTPYYYIEFKNFKDTYGTNTLMKEEDLATLRKGNMPSETDYFIIGSYYKDAGVLYIMGNGKKGMTIENMLGSVKAAKLKAIINKYITQ